MSTEIDVENDELIPVLDLVQQRLGRRLAPSTTWRWITKGVQVRGTAVKLQAVRVGGTWCTSRPAFADFLRRQTSAALHPAEQASEERPESVRRRLRDAGLLD